MFTVFFYKDRDGHEPVLEYIREVAAKTDKDSRIKATKSCTTLTIYAK